MLIQLRVENHRSLRDEQTLSLVATTGHDDDRRLIRSPGLDEALLPAVALYGANASGKSNVVDALHFMRHAVLESHRLWEPESGAPQEPFALSSSKAMEPSLYEVDILVEGIRFRYGFVLDSKKILEEWLFTWPHGRKQTWFQREGDTFEFGKYLHGENETIRGITRSNSLFLSAAAQNNHALLLPIYAWFAGAHVEIERGSGRPLNAMQALTLSELFSNTEQIALFADSHHEQQRDRDIIVRLLQAADVGILNVKVVHRELSGWVRDHGRAAAARRAEIFLLHKAENEEGAWLPLSAESAGTVTLLRMAPLLVRALGRGGVVCIDELEASLHPMLALELLRLFNDPERNPRKAQLIFTTHDTNLLGNVLGERPLRRDQVWFTEKDQAGATHLYPLTDFHPRKEENLERGYLQGRYGAVPFLGGLLSAIDDPEGG